MNHFIQPDDHIDFIDQHIKCNNYSFLQKFNFIELFIFPIHLIYRQFKHLVHIF